MLEETVVIGYGSVKKRDLTGAVSSLKSEDLLKTNPVSINQGLQGKMAGVNVSQSDGAPGAGINIQIRGANSYPHRPRRSSRMNSLRLPMQHLFSEHAHRRLLLLSRYHAEAMH